MQEFKIGANEAGQRFDKFLHKYLKEAGTSFLYKMLRKKNITLNKKNEVLTINLGEENWKVYQVLKQSSRTSKKTSWGCLTLITILALFYAIYELIMM